jgi:hypothetical protein
MVVLSMVAAAALVLPAAGSAKTKYQRERFDVRILGVQETQWGSLGDDHAAECRTKTSGSGSEKLFFHTTKPHRLNLVAGRKAFAYSPNTTKAKAVVTREGYERVTVEDPCPPVAEGDPDGGGGEPPPAPDCGEKEATIGLELEFTRSSVALRSDPSRSTQDLFANCPVYGTYFSDLLTLDGQPGGGAKVLKAKLPLDRMLSHARKDRDFTVSADGELQDNYAEQTTRTAISWDIRFTRKR